jgi:hypothetical protein
MTFQPGDPVRLSKLGESRMKRATARIGKIVGAGAKRRSSQDTLRVHFDGMKNPVSLHRSYIERLKANARNDEAES